MKQRIAHGATIDAATPTEVAQIIAATFDSEDTLDYSRPKGAVLLDGNGNANKRIERVTAQYDWFGERLTLSGSGAPSALVTFYENDPNSAANLLEVIQLGTVGLYSRSFSNDLYLPSMTQLWIVVSGGVAGGQLAYNLQIRQVKGRQG